MQCKIFNVTVESEKGSDQERKMNDFLAATDVKRVFASLANQPGGPMWSVLFFYEGETPMERKPSPKPESAAESANPETPLTGAQVKSIVALKKWRSDQASQEGVPVYMVAQNRWLEEFVRMPVKTLDDLMKIRGLGEWRVRKYGPRILEILNTAKPGRTWSDSSYAGAHA